VLRKIFGPQRDEVRGEWRRLHNDSFMMYFLPNMQVITSRRMRWAGLMAHMGDRRGA